MAIVVKKRISLDFLGEEYKDSYLIFKSVSLDELDNAFKGTVREETVKRFVEGEINQGGEMVKVTKENLTELPGEVFLRAFSELTGTSIDPKS